MLADAKGVLINAQEGKTKALRQWRFDSKKEIDSRLIKAYVKEAVTLQAQGVQIKADRARPVEIPRHLKAALSEDKKANSGFKALSKGKQREYAEYIADAKRDETKIKRIAKIMPMIVAGKGLNDKYRDC